MHLPLHLPLGNGSGTHFGASECILHARCVYTLRWWRNEGVQADPCLQDPLHEDYPTFRTFWELTSFGQLPCLQIIYISSFPRRAILQRVHFCVTKSLSNTKINEGLTLNQMMVLNWENRVSFNWVISAWNLSLMAQFLSVVHGCCWKEICASCLFRVFRSFRGN